MGTSPLPVIGDAAREFLRRHPPFDRMSDLALDFLIPRLKLHHFPRDATILAPESGIVGHLHIVQQGQVGCHSAVAWMDDEPPLGVGEAFPIGALSAGGATTRVYTAMQDTACYLFAREDYLELRLRSLEFERFCTEVITKRLRQSLRQLHGKYGEVAVEQQTLARTLGEIIHRPPIMVAQSTPLADALRAIKETRARSIVIVNDEGAPIGMFTLLDLLERIVLPGRPLSTRIGEVMSVPVIALPVGASAYEALQTMAERSIQQLIVVDGKRVVGLVSEHDLFSLHRVSMGQVSQLLASAHDRDGLRRTANDIRRLTQNLLAQGAAAEPLTRTIASLNDALARQVIALALGRHELGDIDWCWLALGSEGRSEQTFATDQDNAIVFAAASDRDADKLRPRLLTFARDVNETLDAIGFPLCVGNVMASNPELCLSVDEWKVKFLRWIREPTPEALLQADIVFDFRPIYGDTTLVDELREWLFDYTKDNRLFTRFMIQNALEVEPPLGLLRDFVTDDRPHKGTIDLKVRGTRIFVDVARVFALVQGIAETGTANRLRAAAPKLGLPDAHIAAAVEGFHFLQTQRLRTQQAGSKREDANRLDPRSLNEIDRLVLKQAFRQAKKLQHRLRELYQA